MEAKRKRLTLDLDPPVHRRLKVAATLKGISMRQYCLTTIDKELAIDGVDRLPSGRFDIAGLSALASSARFSRVTAATLSGRLQTRFRLWPPCLLP